MPEYLMLLLMQVTLFSSVTACIIICVKQLFKWVIPPSVGVVMWVILLVRLLWPIFPESSVSIYNLIPAGRSIMFTLTNEIDEELSAREELYSEQTNPYVLEGEVYTADAVRQPAYSARLYPQEDTRQTVGEYLADTVHAGRTRSENAILANEINIALLVIYATGTVVALAVNFYVYGKAKKTALGTTLPCTDERTLRVYHSTAEKLGIREGRVPPLKYGSSSMLVGCFSPAVIYREQEGISDHELSMVFAHELNHFKHRDNFVLMLSTVMASFFWYNPLIWIVRHMLREDIEVMCDARTITLCEYRRADYAQMIYHSSESSKRASLAGCHISSGSRQLKNRLRTISRNLENKLLPRIASSVLCVCIIIICLTNPIVSQNIEYKDYIGNYSQLTGESEQTMHLTSTVSVSYYLKQISAIISENFGDSIAKKLGNGSLENFKRTVQTGEHASPAVIEKINALRTDQPLTVESCALINRCIVVILSGGLPDSDSTIPLLPKYISAEKMNSLVSLVSEKDAERLLRSYNRGVAGADVRLQGYYTEAMFELILSRLDSEESRELWNSFYSKIDLTVGDMTSICERLGIEVESLEGEDYLYVVSPNLTSQEKKILHSIIRSAYAGQDEAVYYLKESIEGYSEFGLRHILTGVGYTVETMVNDYAKIGIPQYEHFTLQNIRYLTKTQYEVIDIRLDGSGVSAADLYSKLEGTDFYTLEDPKDPDFAYALDYLNRMTFVTVRDAEADGVTVKGLTGEDVRDAVLYAYSLGLIDSVDGEVVLSDQLSCGQSLYYSYKLVCSIVNANR